MSTLNLVVVSHPDDEVLGFGGTGRNLVEAGETVQPIILCGDVHARAQRPELEDLYKDMTRANSILGFNQPIVGTFPNMKMNNTSHIDIVSFIEEQLVRFKPSRIFTHHPSDLNNDHINVSDACQVASKLPFRNNDIPPIDALYFMEVLSSTEWRTPITNLTFQANVFVDISSSIDKKIEALMAYRNVMRPAPHSRSEHVIKGLAAYRGGQCYSLYAEAFQLAYKKRI